MRFSTVQAATVAQLATTVFAHPHAAPAAEGSALHKRAVTIDAFKNKLGAAPAKYVTNEVIVEGKPKTPTRRAAAADADVAADQVKKLYPSAQFRQVSSYSSRNGVTHVYFKQTANGIDIDTADFNVNVSILTSFWKYLANNLSRSKVARSSPTVTLSTRVLSQLRLQSQSALLSTLLLLSRVSQTLFLSVLMLRLPRLRQRMLLPSRSLDLPELFPSQSENSSTSLMPLAT